MSARGFCVSCGESVREGVRFLSDHAPTCEFRKEWAQKEERAAEAVYRRLFTGKGRLAVTLRMYPNPKPEIIAAIKEELQR